MTSPSCAGDTPQSPRDAAPPGHGAPPGTATATAGTPAPRLIMLALGLAFAVGAALSLQSYVNGQLGRAIGSTTVTAAINQWVALIVTLAIAILTGALARGWKRLRTNGRPPLWCFLGGLAGVAVVLIGTVAAPRVGVALLTVALVCGMTAGSLPIDAAGLGPGGVRPITPPRVAGVAIAIAATMLATLGARGELRLGLLVLAVAVGVTIALQGAANGRLAEASGEAFFASFINTVLGAALLLIIAAVVSGPPASLPSNPLLYAGGILGSFMVVGGAIAVQTLGVLRMGLTMVAGQSTGALAIDLIAPAPGEEPTLATALAVVLTVVAVAVSGMRRRGQRSG